MLQVIAVGALPELARGKSFSEKQTPNECLQISERQSNNEQG
jgi:hypothetical protein